MLEEFVEPELISTCHVENMDFMHCTWASGHAESQRRHCPCVALEVGRAPVPLAMRPMNANATNTHLQGERSLRTSESWLRKLHLAVYNHHTRASKTTSLFPLVKGIQKRSSSCVGDGMGLVHFAVWHVPPTQKAPKGHTAHAWPSGSPTSNTEP
jgi:hypothetical protein